MLAAELAIAGVDALLVDRLPSQGLLGSRGLGLHSRMLEVFDQRGIVDRFLSEGFTAQTQVFGGAILDISDFPTRYPYGLGLRQDRVEEIMAAWAGELGVRVDRPREVTGFAQDEAGVDIAFADGKPVRAQYLVACDGGRSVIRKAAGIAFPGTDPTTTSLVAEVKMRDEPELGFRRDDKGQHAIGKLGDGDLFRLVVNEGEVQSGAEPTLADLSAALVAVYSTDFGVHHPRWIGRFSDGARQAAAYRAGRVLLAGDAAHVHSPVGGQGLHTGVQDAVNLGWKLAQVLQGTAPDDLLDTYEAERHPVGALVVRSTLAQTALMRGDERTIALREMLAEIVTMDGPRKHLAGMLSGLDVHYDLGDGHPLLGRRMPDLDLITPDGPAR